MKGWYRIAGLGSVRWIYGTHADGLAAMRFVGVALMNAEQTTRPAFREMIDTLDWDAIL